MYYLTFEAKLRSQNLWVAPYSKYQMTYMIRFWEREIKD